MKFIKWFKWIFSFLILIVALVGIIWGTIFVLNNNGLKKEEKKEVKRVIEKITSNETRNNLSEIYNIYLNNEKHKVKVEYQLISRSDESLCILLYVYFDGKKSLEKEVTSLQEEITLHEVFLHEDIDNIKTNESSFVILKENEIEYLLVNVGVNDDAIKKYYYLINNNGDVINNKGILVSDNSKDYLTGEGGNFNNYYDNERKLLAKIDGNDIYALEEMTEKKKINLIEYKYYFKDGKLKKEKMQVFEDIKLNVKENTKKD